MAMERQTAPSRVGLRTATGAPEHDAGQGRSAVPSRFNLMGLPVEIREMVWRLALPGPRTFHALVYASVDLKMQILNRPELGLPLAHACFESRRVVREAGYVLAFRNDENRDDPGLWFHLRRDVIERTIWGPGDFWDGK